MNREANKGSFEICARRLEHMAPLWEHFGKLHSRSNFTGVDSSVQILPGSPAKVMGGVMGTHTR